MIGYHPENLAAKFVYQKAGFKETEFASCGEQLGIFETIMKKASETVPRHTTSEWWGMDDF